MKKRVYFMVSSIITYFLSIYSMIVANETVQITIEELKKLYTSFPQTYQDRMIGMYETEGFKIIILFGIVVGFINILLFVFAYKNTLLKHKGLVITFTILSFAFSDRLLVQGLAIAGFIIILCSKRKNPEDFPDKTKKIIPKIELPKQNLKDMLLGILLLIVYFSQFIWSNYIPDNFNQRMLIEIVFNIVMITLAILIFYRQLKENLTLFIQNFKAYISFILPKFGMSYVFLFLASLISLLITRNAVSVNQQSLESLPRLYLMPAALIYAPIVEELIFRGTFRRFIKNKVLFITLSAISFGILHTMSEASTIEILVMSLPYSVLGGFLAYIYTKTNNIWSNIFSHFLFNLISTIIIFLL